MLGVLPTLTAAPSGIRAMLIAAGGSVATAFVAVLLAQTGGWAPWLGTGLVVLLSLATGALVLRGLHPVGAAAISFAAYVLVDPSSVIRFLDARSSPWAAAAMVAGLVWLGDRRSRDGAARGAPAAGRSVDTHPALRDSACGAVRAVHPGLCPVVPGHQRGGGR